MILCFFCKPKNQTIKSILKIQQLTFTRFIAAISIVIFHYGTKSPFFSNEDISFLFKQANIGVSYFFILSGFVMIIAYGNSGNINFTNYLKNRLARIYPIYLLALFLVIIFSLSFSNINISDFLLYIFMLQAWIPEKALIINFPSWSLSVELFFYVTFPFLINRLYSKQPLKITAIWIILFWLVSQVLLHLIIYKSLDIDLYSIQDIFYHPLMHFNEFLIGNLTGLFFIEKLKEKKKNYLPAILITLTLLILLLKFPIGLNFHNGLLAVIFVPLILFISLSNDKVTKIFARKEFVFLGEISFGIYILQVPIWAIFSNYRMQKYLGLNKELDFTASFFIRLAVLIVASIFNYLYFEKPMRNLIKNYGQPKLEEEINKL